MLLPLCKFLSHARFNHMNQKMSHFKRRFQWDNEPKYSFHNIVEGTKYSEKCRGRRKFSYWCNWRPMRKQYFTPLLCHYAECTIYPQRCYDKQTSSLFGRYNLRFVIRFNIELRPFTSSSSQSLEDDEDADVSLPLSLGSAHLFPAPNLAEQQTHIARQRFVPSVRWDLHISRKPISTFVNADLIHENLCQTLNTEIRIESV